MGNRLHWEVFVSTQARVVTSDLAPGAAERRWSPISSTLRALYPDRLNPGALWSSARGVKG
jgi:hypothetical protein